jgi:hypothetical protein
VFAKPFGGLGSWSAAPEEVARQPGVANGVLRPTYSKPPRDRHFRITAAPFMRLAGVDGIRLEIGLTLRA